MLQISDHNKVIIFIDRCPYRRDILSPLLDIDDPASLRQIASDVHQ